MALPEGVMGLDALVGRSACLYAWCPCGEGDTVYEKEGGPLKLKTLRQFARRHAGHEGTRYCDLQGVLFAKPPSLK